MDIPLVYFVLALVGIGVFVLVRAKPSTRSTILKIAGGVGVVLAIGIFYLRSATDVPAEAAGRQSLPVPGMTLVFVVIVAIGVVAWACFRFRPGPYSVAAFVAIGVAALFFVDRPPGGAEVLEYRAGPRPRLVLDAASADIETEIDRRPGAKVFRASVSGDSSAMWDARAWAASSRLNFRPPEETSIPPWLPTALEQGEETIDVAGTRFCTVAEPDGFVYGFSDPARSVAAAEYEARQRAAYKLAVRCLLELKRAQPERDVISLVPIAESIARYDYEGPMKVHLEWSGSGGGRLYRAAVGLPAESADLGRTAGDILERHERISRRRESPLGFAIAGLAVLALFGAFLVAVFIGASRTGRWAIPLRLVSGALVGVLCWGVIYAVVQIAGVT